MQIKGLEPVCATGETEEVSLRVEFDLTPFDAGYGSQYELERIYEKAAALIDSL